jgi:hypothetical protein
VQDDLGTVHFSRFMVKGDEKLLFLADIDGEVDTHIERLVASAGPVFDAIFTHIEDPPATPVARNPERVIRWLRQHIREPLDTYFAYEDASVQDIKAAARAAGFTGHTSQSPLLTGTWGSRPDRETIPRLPRVASPLRRWVNDSEFAGAVRLHPQSKDPLIGTQDPAESLFVIPQAHGGPPIEVTGLSSFVTTRAAAYVFLPSITAITFIANVGEGL